MKLSRIAAKTLVRLFLILVLVALLPIITGNAGNLEHLYISTDNKLALVMPMLLILSFITLLVICTRNRYQHADLNWVLVINIVVLIAYGVMVWMKIRQLS
jgi:hypothetical protein